MIGVVVALAAGYVLGAKAGRRRYEQIAGTYKAVTGSPAAKSVIEASRRKIANKVSPDPPLVTLTELEDGAEVLGPQESPERREVTR